MFETGSPAFAAMFLRLLSILQEVLHCGEVVRGERRWRLP
jgi:hypothetical protein